jgi:hypothetical protein
LRIARKLAQPLLSCQGPRYNFVGGLGIVGKPDSRRGGGRCLLAGLFGEDGDAPAPFRENDAAAESGNPGADDGCAISHVIRIPSPKRLRH